MTACRDPACTTGDIELPGLQFLSANPPTLVTPSPNRERLGRARAIAPQLLMLRRSNTRNDACRNQADFDIAPESDLSLHNSHNMMRRMRGH